MDTLPNSTAEAPASRQHPWRSHAQRLRHLPSHLGRAEESLTAPLRTKQRQTENFAKTDPENRKVVRGKRDNFPWTTSVVWEGSVLTVICYLMRLIFRIDSPFSSIRCAVCTILSSMTSAIVGSPIASYHSETGICEVMMIDLRPCLSSIISRSIGRSFESSPIMKRSSSTSRGHFSIFFMSAS